MPAPSKRPAREHLAQAIRHRGGVLRRVALDLNCTPPTLYKWIRQLDLAQLAQLPETLGPVNVDAESKVNAISTVDGKYPKNYSKRSVNKDGSEAPRLGGMSEEQQAMTVATTKIPSELWAWTRKRAIDDQKRSAAEIVVEALREYRQRREQEQAQ